MKAVFFALIISIFFTINICNAQSKSVSDNKAKNQISLCNLKGTKIHLDEINKLMADGCDKIIYTDAGGKSLPLIKYVIAISPAKGGNSYFEQVIGNKLTTTITERLGKLNTGDLITIAQVVDAKSTSTVKSGNATIMYKIIE
jgi:hypothetical protein